MTNKKIFWYLVLLCVITLIPFLGYEYNTKGEPREAIVSMTMLDSGNWILPLNNGGEMPYKPMFLHWCIALVSLLTGAVTEFTSRIPSALALTATVVTTFWFYAKRRQQYQALITALLLLTCLELHRAGGNCRVDMVLTACTVGAISLLYRWQEKGMKGLPWLALLLMSLGTLTKGPVGAIIPCFVMGCFLLLQRVNLFRAFFTMIGFVLIACILPALWYVAAWQQGGQEFLDLVYDENIGRMSGTMTYQSHEGPWYFNVITLISGMVPFTILLLMGVCTEKFNLKPSFTGGFKAICLRFWHWLDGMNRLDQFSFVAATMIFFFYCIPSSKRSVYLMPMYPYMCWFIARYIVHLADSGRHVVRNYGHLLAGICILLLVCFCILKLHIIPDSIFHGKHAYDNQVILHSLEGISGFLPAFCITLTTVAAVRWWFYTRRQKGVSRMDLSLIMMLTIAFYLSFDGAYKPAALAGKSQKALAAELQQKVLLPADEGVYEYIEEAEAAAGDPLHFFELNFFLHNRIENFKRQQPEHGFLLIGEEDAALRLPEFERLGYHFEQRFSTPKRVIHQPLNVYYFGKGR